MNNMFIIVIIVILAGIGVLSFALSLLADVARWTKLTEILLQLSLVVLLIAFILTVVLGFIDFILSLLNSI